MLPYMSISLRNVLSCGSYYKCQYNKDKINLFKITSLACSAYGCSVGVLTKPHSVFTLTHLPETRVGISKTGFRQVKIMKELFWINRIFFLNLAFGQVGEKKIKTKDCRLLVTCNWPLCYHLMIIAVRWLLKCYNHFHIKSTVTSYFLCIF